MSMLHYLQQNVTLDSYVIHSARCFIAYQTWILYKEQPHFQALTKKNHWYSFDFRQMKETMCQEPHSQAVGEEANADQSFNILITIFKKDNLVVQ